MIITLKGANFASSNIGTLSTWTVSRVLGSGATYNGVTHVDKNAALSATVTIATGYELGSAGVTVTMGGSPVTSGITTSGNVITISIGSVTGNVVIKVPTVNTSTGEEDSGNESTGGSGSSGTATELTFTTSGFYNNSSQGGGITSPNTSWYMSDLIPIDTLTNGSSGYCTSMLQGHSKVAVVYYASSNSTDASAFLGSYGTVTQGEQAQYTAEQVKENAPEGTTYVGFSTHASLTPFNVYVIG